MNPWNRYWYGPVSAVRPYLLVKGFLILLAFDTWTGMIAHGARYGAGGFNVAHFRWLDALHPVPTAAWYVGLMLLIGWLALVTVLAGTNRLVLGLIAVLYTYGWSMSLLDRYQHHYFISLVLLCLTFLPPIRGADVLGPSGESNTGGVRPSRHQGPQICAWSFRLLAATVAIVYAWTAVAKLDAEWRNGLALRSIAETKPVAAWFRDIADGVGIGTDTFWIIASAAVVVLELFLTVSYLLAPVCRDGRRWRMLAWLVALALHVGNEVLALRIGWFSHYMIVLASVYFLPSRWLAAVATLATWPMRWLGTWAGRPVDFAALGSVVAVVVTAGLVAATGTTLDLPGAPTATIVMAALFVAAAVIAKARGLPVTVAAGLAAILMWAAVVHSRVRFDFYTFHGHSLVGSQEGLRRQVMYRKSLDYAPDDRSRARAHNHLAMVCEQEDRLDDAIEHYRQAVRLAGGVFEVRRNLGMVLRARGRVEEAIDQLRAAVAINPDHGRTHHDLATVLAENGELEQAVHHYREATRCAPQFAAAHHGLGLALNLLGRSRDAVEHFRLALQLEPQWPTALNALAWVLATDADEQVRRPEEAVRLAERAAELTGHRDLSILDTLAAAEASAGRFDRAVNIATRALRLAESAGSKQAVEQIRSHLELYRKSTPAPGRR